MALTYTDLAQIQPAYDELKSTFMSGKTKPLAWRKVQLERLSLMISENEPAWVDALHSDLSRPRAETLLSDTRPMLASAAQAIENLEEWAAPVKVDGGPIWAATEPQLIPQPKGVVLVLGAWNFPIRVTLDPVVGALAAGNTVMIKPSELAPHIAALFASLVPKYFDPTAVKVVNGAIAESTAFLKLKWDHIFYTGSGTVGRIIARAAAEHLTPCTLELGGKSPTVVFDDADLITTARRILWAKYTNSGQLCITPDYVLCTEETQAKLIVAFRTIIDEFGEIEEAGKKVTPVESDTYSSIVNAAHYARIEKLIETTKGKIVIEGGRNKEKNKIGITVVADVKADDPLMQGEIFGPVLPILVVKDAQAAVNLINAGDTPLALYVFSESKANSDFIFSQTRSGTFVHGDTLVQFACDNLPFGGVGESGYGSYHGKATFDVFSHMRSHMTVPAALEPAFAARYPPYTDEKLKLMTGGA